MKAIGFMILQFFVMVLFVMQSLHGSVGLDRNLWDILYPGVDSFALTPEAQSIEDQLYAASEQMQLDIDTAYKSKLEIGQRFLAQSLQEELRKHEDAEKYLMQVEDACGKNMRIEYQLEKQLQIEQCKAERKQKKKERLAQAKQASSPLHANMQQNAQHVDRKRTEQVKLFVAVVQHDTKVQQRVFQRKDLTPCCQQSLDAMEAAETRRKKQRENALRKQEEAKVAIFLQKQKEKEAAEIEANLLAQAQKDNQKITEKINHAQSASQRSYTLPGKEGCKSNIKYPHVYHENTCIASTNIDIKLRARGVKNIKTIICGYQSCSKIGIDIKNCIVSDTQCRLSYLFWQIFLHDVTNVIQASIAEFNENIRARDLDQDDSLQYSIAAFLDEENETILLAPLFNHSMRDIDYEEQEKIYSQLQEICTIEADFLKQLCDKKISDNAIGYEDHQCLIEDTSKNLKTFLLMLKYFHEK